MLSELAGTLAALCRLPLLPSVLRGLPRGAGEEVVVIPGFMMGDGATLVLRRALVQLGYRVRGWELGRNQGRVRVDAAALADALCGPTILIGWSLGGVVAREVAHLQPASVTRIVTLGTPVQGGPKHTVFSRLYRRRGADIEKIASAADARAARPLTIPLTAVFTRSDGVVAWTACIDPWNEVDYQEVSTSHLGLVLHPEAIRSVAEAIARQ